MATDTMPDNREIPRLPIKYEELLDHLNIIQELVVSLDRQGSVTYINRNGCKILGYKDHQLIGKNWFDTVISNADRQRIKRVFAEVLAGQHDHSARWENDVVTANGDLRRIDFHSTFIQDGEGHITGSLSSGVDVTAVRLQERKLAELQNRLSQMTGLGILGEMAVELAHEVNQPLSAISTFTDACLRLLDRDSPDLSRLKHGLQQVSQQARRAGDVVRRMREGVQQPASDRALVDCNVLIRDLMDIIRADAYNTQVNTTLDLEEPLQEVCVDPLQIQRVILNYVRNAIDALASVTDRRVSIQTRRDGDTIRCSVIDNGCGVSEKAVAELFNPFFTTKEAGVGMGLSLCKTIIQHHGGQVDYQPNAGRGAVFSFTLPIPATNPSSLARPQSERPFSP